MKYGVCIGMDFQNIKIAKECGFDYVESCFHAVTNASEEEYQTLVAEVKKNDILCEAVNCFIPGFMPVCGDNVDYEALKAYIERGMSRAKPIGVKAVVFGSGDARKIPDGCKASKAFVQLAYFLKEIVAPIAEKYEITVVVEPLFRGDSNVIHTLFESVMLASLAESEYVKGLADLYHFVQNRDFMDDFKLLKGEIFHAHIAEPKNRVYPGSKNEYDYKSYIDALEEAGCERMSIEANTKDFANEAKIAIDLLRSL